MHQSRPNCYAAQFCSLRIFDAHAMSSQLTALPAHLLRATIVTIEFLIIRGTAEVSWDKYALKINLLSSSFPGLKPSFGEQRKKQAIH